VCRLRVHIIALNRSLSSSMPLTDLNRPSDAEENPAGVGVVEFAQPMRDHSQSTSASNTVQRFRPRAEWTRTEGNGTILAVRPERTSGACLGFIRWRTNGNARDFTPFLDRLFVARRIEETAQRYAACLPRYAHPSRRPSTASADRERGLPHVPVRCSAPCHCGRVRDLSALRSVRTRVERARAAATEAFASPP
jgi:hypothetical protein